MDIVSTVSETGMKSRSIPPAKLRRMLEKMLTMRMFEEKVEELYLKMALITGPCHLYLGMEAIATGASEAINEDDYVLATYRGHGHAIAKGVPLEKILAELMGRVDGTCKGIGGSMHVATWTEKNLMLATAIVGSGIPIAAGIGLGVKKKGSSRVVLSFFGDGAVNSGAFNEGINMAAVWKVPTIYICENNLYAMSLPQGSGIASKTIAERAASYQIPTFVSDGNDPTSVYEAVDRAARLCRQGQGPAFVECRTYRMKGHGIYDKAEYRPPTEVEEWRQRDPIDLFQKLLAEDGIITQEDVEGMRRRVEHELEDAVKKARASPVTDFSSLHDLVYPERRE